MPTQRLRIFSISLFLLLFSNQSMALTLIYTNDVMGEIEPCGCKNNPQGGWDRKYQLIRSLKDPEILQLDSGNLFFESAVLPESLQNQARLQAETVVSMMNQLQHDAVVPGPYDFALGLDFFQTLFKKSNFAFLAANFSAAGAGNFLSPYKVFERKNTQGKTLKIAVLGLMGDQWEYPSGITVSPVIASAEKEAKAIRKKIKPDLLIALTHQGFEADKVLAEKVKGIDIIIGGGSGSFLQAPQKVRDTYIYQSLYRNRWLGTVKLDAPFSNSDHQQVNLDAIYAPEGADLKSNPLVAAMEAFKKSVAEINANEARSEAQSLVQNQEKFHTFVSCMSCHSEQFHFWRKTKHTDALSPLLKAKQLQNKDCLRCHTVGFSQPSGWSQIDDIVAHQEDKKITLPSLTAWLKKLQQAKTLQEKHDGQPLEQYFHSLKHSYAPVQCENCHGPAGDHPFTPFTQKKVSDQVCFTCHNAERSPHWYQQKNGKSQLIDELFKQNKARVSCPSAQ